MVIATCGKLCSGKTTYARTWAEQNNTVLLSPDRYMLAIFGQDAGERHDEYVRGLTGALYETARDIARTGVSVILDSGLWTRATREAFRSTFAAWEIPTQIHYLRIPDSEWYARIEKRNQAILAGLADGYYVDEGLLRKFETSFEVPAPDEVDCIIS